MATQLICPHCRKVMEISGAAPAFCAYCGQSLSKSTVAAPPHPSTGAGPFDAEASTLAPREGGTTEIWLGNQPQSVGKYKLIRRLGSGGMGTVFEAEHSETGRRVALKLLSRELAGSSDGLQRFRQEGRLASAIAHPRCVFVYAADEADGKSYIVMELMPGETLRDLVDEKGPLSPSEAIARILDVIDGLLEAHRLEVIHRDVKPSNCFLEPDGRVKVGDFGLAKSLVSTNKASLTRTGTFLGTPHFASPEQVKGEPVSPQTDVYSVAATLYFLLTGKPPFSGSDVAATLARIVCDPPESMRTLRPDLPVSLDRAVLKGLERDRQRRYQDLQEFRDALVSLLPRAASRSGLAVRLAAFVADMIVVMLVIGIVKSFIRSTAALAFDESAALPALLAAEAIGALIWFAYFAVSEPVWGGSPGKRWLRLRVRAGDGAEKPTPSQLLGRTAVAFALFDLGWLAAPAVLAAVGGADVAAGPWKLVAAWGWFAVGAILAVLPMRRHNGYRGLHELVSGTRVVALPWPKKRPKPISALGWFLYLKRSGRLTRDAGPSAALPNKLGGFAIRGAMHLAADDKVLLGEDPSLGRKVLIYARPADRPEVDANRLTVDRSSRVRWLGNGIEKELRWDAFLAPQGCPLPELIASEKRLPWSEVRPMLEQLADELAAAWADGTLPQRLDSNQVWVQLNGQVQLVDLPPDYPTEDVSEIGNEAANRRSLALLREVAIFALEGRPLPAGERPLPVRAPMPEHAQRIVNRLIGVHDEYTTIGELRADLNATVEQPMEVGPANRGTQLALQAAFLLPGLLLMFLPGVILPDLWGGGASANDLAPSATYDRIAWTAIGAAVAWPLAWAVWAFLTGGGLSYSMTGISLVNAVGCRASRFCCLMRALMVWGPIALLLVSTYWWPLWFDIPQTPAMFRLCWLSCWAIIAALLAMYALRAMMSPLRALHDRLADVYMVPQ